jgi:hypothetical protein
MEKYADVPMSFADACLVRMTETLADPMLLTTDADFRIYRRHSRQTVPCVTPADPLAIRRAYSITSVTRPLDQTRGGRLAKVRLPASTACSSASSSSRRW